MPAKTVLISGVGIAGPTLAYWLNAAGFEPVLVERSRRPRSGGFVIDFWGLGYEIAERMGMKADLERNGYHVRELRIVDDRGVRIAGFGSNVFRQLTGGPFVTLGRSDLARLLFEKIEAAVEVMFDDEIVDIQQHADHVRARLRNGGERRFDLLIGADGLHSNVRRLVFGPKSEFETQLGYIVAAFQVPGYRPRDQDVYVIHNRPGRMVARFALHFDRSLFLFVFVADPPTLPLDLAAQKAMLREKYRDAGWECREILGELERADDLYFDQVSQIKMTDWSRGRIALVGDAAFCLSLMAGQGSALAMAAAYALAGELAKAEGRHELAFSSYERLLRDHIVSKQEAAARFSAAFAPKTEWGLFLRNQVIKACAIPGVARVGIGREVADKMRLPDYHWPAPAAAGS
jgi:2-polyprenyl-6-methoxyphenol hydroxylase-like FAD-dependent oxidoreductase